eukprot:TRINITY_DN3846_c0_g1_i2.p1 TRINITY_DN3846_c0_g1~~TRINITY_DN3846_c0_g1_i2.p1  ORF type:complete len:424 (+),score=67.21 TRINITY_DN3846_c0_g1_i2:1393-2664(+)
MTEAIWKRLALIKRLLKCSEKGVVQERPKAIKRVSDAEAARILANKYRGRHTKKLRNEDTILYAQVVGTMETKKKAGVGGWDVGIKTHNAALSVFSRMSDTRSCDKLFASIPVNIKKDVQTYNNVLLAHAKNASRLESQQLYIQYLSKMRQQSLMEGGDYTLLTKLLFYRNVPKKAFARLRSQVLSNSNKKQAIPSGDVVTELIESSGEKSPSIEVLNTAISCHSTGRHSIIFFEKFFVNKPTKQYDPDRHTLLAFLKTCDGSETRLASKVFNYCCGDEDSHQGFFKATVVEWTALLNIYKSANNISALNRIWDKLIAHVEPNSFTYATYIKGCLADPEKGILYAKEKYKLALKNFEVSMIHVHQNMLEVLIAVGDVSGAEEVMMNVRELGVSNDKEINRKYSKFLKQQQAKGNSNTTSLPSD